MFDNDSSFVASNNCVYSKYQLVGEATYARLNRVKQLHALLPFYGAAAFLYICSSFTTCMATFCSFDTYYAERMREGYCSCLVRVSVRLLPL